MKITFLSAVGTIGGAETSLLGLLMGLRRIAPEVRLQVIAGEDGPLLESVRTLGAEATVISLGSLSKLGDAQFGSLNGSGSSGKLQAILAFPAALPSFVEYARKLKWSLAQTQPDIVHSNGMKMHLISAVGTPSGVPVVWHMHDYVGSRTLMRRLLKIALLRRPWLVGVSRSVVKDLEASLPCLPERTTYVYNSVDSDKFSVDGVTADLDALAGITPALPGTIRIGFVGTFARWKGHAVFLKALAALSRAIRFRAYVVGAPVYATPHSQYDLEELKSICRSLEIEDRVAFTGFCGRTSEVYRALDILVHASVEPEPFGMVLLESMCAGTPVITTAYGGAAEICTDGENCLVCRPGDADSMAAAIVTLCRDPELRRRLASTALAQMPRRFHPEPAAAAIMHVYLRATAIQSRDARRARKQPRAAACLPFRQRIFWRPKSGTTKT
jgi:glycosyltransferase involved in cell wall biosynthesis